MTTTTDERGCSISGATAAALPAYERALAAFGRWRRGAEAHLAQALEEAPGFVMAHLMQAWLRLASRDLRRIQSARPLLARAAGLRANERERLHLDAIAAVLDDDYEGAKERLGEALKLQPRDLLALQLAHALDYLTGDVVRMNQRVEAVLPAWSSGLPGHHAVLAMHAFALEESGEYDRAEQAARKALEINPMDARAHHVMAHIFEMTDRPDAGAQWLEAHAAAWSADTLVATHCWWHLALFELARGRLDRALALYDERVRLGHSSELADLIDASALQWRLLLHGVDTGARAAELADAWAPHVDDGFCSFSDLHAMLAFVAARDWAQAQRLERVLVQARSRPTRHGTSTRVLGLPACRALMAFGRGDDARSVELLARLPALAHRLGGSHAQRDVLQLTARRASARLQMCSRGWDPRIRWVDRAANVRLRSIDCITG